ncbi:DNA mismatch repair protein MutT [Saccharomonospora piscinae]|uniref:DNA mismatch repair protein MutT n=1 Tax=Saccharomonospora piscinae TaxID=687388 RepID=A0A1V9A0T4_SACPI|nr:NUDIX domain-containing protein [Saccharomonospora piscinae]OQO90623.1 DNA mismatch repair protein MutT [Saccharomonospora piscinae]
MFIDKVAWLLLRDGCVLGARSRGEDVYFLPGGKREPGESDLDTLVREVAEELAVDIVTGTARHSGTVEAPAHGRADGVVRMSCYTADYEGELTASSEVAELRWLTHADRHLVSTAGGLVLDELRERGLLR